jgi:hypothetical protein
MKSITLVALTALVSALGPHSTSDTATAQAASLFDMQSVMLRADFLSFEEASDGPSDPDLNECIGVSYKNPF